MDLRKPFDDCYKFSVTHAMDGTLITEQDKIDFPTSSRSGQFTRYNKSDVEERIKYMRSREISAQKYIWDFGEKTAYDNHPLLFNFDRIENAGQVTYRPNNNFRNALYEYMEEQEKAKRKHKDEEVEMASNTELPF